MSVHLYQIRGLRTCESLDYFYDASIATAGSSGRGVHTNHFGAHSEPASMACNQ